MTRGMFLKNASSVFVAGLLLPVLVYGQSTHKEQCNQLLKRQTEASAGHQSDVLVSNGRELIANCSDIFPTTEQVGFLSTVGQGLIGLNQSQDAIPVLQKCVSMEPDFAPCWLELGIANENLGKIPEARDCYRKAIRIGGSSQQNAAAVGAAKVRLSNFESKQSLETSSRHSEWVDLKHDNRVVHAFIVYPEVKERVPAIIVIHAIYGLTDWDRSLADQLAAAGYVAIAPDLLSGFGPKGGGWSEFATEQDALKAVSGLDQNIVTADLNAAADYVKKLPAGNGKVAVAGTSWGGGQAFRFAANRHDLSAAFVFYGRPPQDVTTITAPVYGFYAGNDPRIDATIPDTIAAMKQAAKKYDPVTYEGAGHGFMRPGDNNPTNTAARTQAWERWVILLKAM